VAPIAEAAGASIEDTTALLGVLADNGIKGSMAGTSTSSVFSRLQAPIGKAPEALRELGITTRDGKGNMLPVEKILKDIDRSFKKNKLGTAQQAEYLKVIFGEEAMKGAVKLVAAAGNGKLAEKQSKLMNAGGTAESIATVRMDNLDGDLKNLSSAWEDLEIEVFEKQDSALRKLTVTATDAAMGPISAAFEPLKPMFNWFSDKVKQLSNWFADLIKPVKATQETLDVATNAGKLFGEGLAAALSLPMDALNTLRSGIDWVLEKLGVIDSKSTGLADNVPKDNPYAGGYSPSGGVLYGGYQPVTANTGTTIVDSSVTTNDIKITIPPGMSRQDAERMMTDALAKNERDKRARQRGQMEND
uniref:phage tail tape measure protein n=1 Tax=Yersinia enterocolitica TaxID=630 RepID=UPI000362DA69